VEKRNWGAGEMVEVESREGVVGVEGERARGVEPRAGEGMNVRMRGESVSLGDRLGRKRENRHVLKKTKNGTSQMQKK
jgi:hypothetical protein